MIDLAAFFARSYVINLDDDKQRLTDFRARTTPDRWPFVQPERWRAVAGKAAPHPDWWRAGGGAWGCLRSHFQIIERCLIDDVPSVLILEDDAIPCDDFAARVRSFLEAVPNDWGMIYLGGQHLFAGSHPPKPVAGGMKRDWGLGIGDWHSDASPSRTSTSNPLRLAADGTRSVPATSQSLIPNPQFLFRPPTADHRSPVYRPYNVNRTHAFALSRAGMKAVYQHLCRQDWQAGQHIDHHLGRLHMDGSLPIYCPRHWLIGQAGGKSRISNRTPGLRFWKDANELAGAVPQPFVAIVGLHSSGSSVLAAICWHLGLHLGNTFVGYHKVDALHPGNRGYEASGLARICESAARFPSTEIAADPRLRKQLSTWIAARQAEAQPKNTIAGGKYPHLCRMGEQLQSICGDALYVIHCDRKLEESIESLKRRVQLGSPKCTAEEADAVQRWLHEGKRQFLADIPPQRQITVSYDSLLLDSEHEVLRLAEFLNLAPLPEQVAGAAAVVRSEVGDLKFEI